MSPMVSRAFVDINKVALEAAFVDEFALLQPTPGYMRVIKDRSLAVWNQRQAEARREQRRRGHPGVRRTHPAARVRPVGPGVGRLPPGAAAAVLPAGNRVRQQGAQLNRRNRTAFQLLGARNRR